MWTGEDFLRETLWPRDLFRSVEPWIQRKEAIVVFGPRRSGKTSFLKWLCRLLHTQGGRTFYFDLEDPNDFDLLTSGPKTLSRFIGNKKAFVFLDEFPYLPDPTSFVKQIVDWYGHIKLFLTGSSQLRLLQKTASKHKSERRQDSLIGRVVEFFLYPLNFREFLQFRGAEEWMRILGPSVWPDWRFPQEGIVPLTLQEYLDEYLRYGGFPEVVLAESEDIKIRLLSQMFRLYAVRDLRDTAIGVDETALEKVFLMIANSAGSPFNAQEIAREVGISLKTVQRYVTLLQSLFLVNPLRPFYFNPRTEIRKRPKFYLIDTGLLGWALGTFTPLKKRPKMAGWYVETAMATRLRSVLPPETRLHYWQDKKGHEVDFVWVQAGDIRPIEVKFRREPRLSTGLKAFLRRYRPSQAMVVTQTTWREEIQRDTDTRIIFLPAAYALA